MARTIDVKITADTSQLRRQLGQARLSVLRLRLSLERSWWRRLWVRFEIWRIEREAAA